MHNLTTAVNIAFRVMQRISREMAADMKAEGIGETGIPAAHVIAMVMVSKQIGFNCIVTRAKIPLTS